MKIVVNGQEAEVQPGTLATALVELGYGAAKVATAVNEAFVPAATRGALELRAGDRVEIVAPQQGG
jgi:sulfur carrier protein